MVLAHTLTTIDEESLLQHNTENAHPPKAEEHMEWAIYNVELTNKRTSEGAEPDFMEIKSVGHGVKRIPLGNLLISDKRSDDHKSEIAKGSSTELSPIDLGRIGTAIAITSTESLDLLTSNNNASSAKSDAVTTRHGLGLDRPEGSLPVEVTLRQARLSSPSNKLSLPVVAVVKPFESECQPPSPCSSPQSVPSAVAAMLVDAHSPPKSIELQSVLLCPQDIGNILLHASDSNHSNLSDCTFVTRNVTQEISTLRQRKPEPCLDDVIFNDNFSSPSSSLDPSISLDIDDPMSCYNVNPYHASNFTFSRSASYSLSRKQKDKKHIIPPASFSYTPDLPSQPSSPDSTACTVIHHNDEIEPNDGSSVRLTSLPDNSTFNSSTAMHSEHPKSKLDGEGTLSHKMTTPSSSMCRTSTPSQRNNNTEGVIVIKEIGSDLIAILHPTEAAAQTLEEEIVSTISDGHEVGEDFYDHNGEQTDDDIFFPALEFAIDNVPLSAVEEPLNQATSTSDTDVTDEERMHNHSDFIVPPERNTATNVIAFPIRGIEDRGISIAAPDSSTPEYHSPLRPEKASSSLFLENSPDMVCIQA